MVKENGQTEWQDVLRVYDNANPGERERIASNLGVDVNTVRRWERKEMKPTGARIRPLATMIPGLEVAMTRALKKAYPESFTDINPDDLAIEYSPMGSISPVHSARALEDYATMAEESSHYSIMRRSLRQMILSLDRPSEGLVAVFAQCVPPTEPGGNVTRLRLNRGFGTDIWRVNQIEREYRIGSRSLAATAVKSGEPAFWPFDSLQQLPSEYILHRDRINSSGAFPVKRYGKVAGSVFVGSTLPDFFTPARCDTIVQWLFILALAFRDSDFYPLSQIDFYAGTSHTLQDEALDMVDDKVREVMEREPHLSSEEIEQKAREELHAKYCDK